MMASESEWRKDYLALKDARRYFTERCNQLRNSPSETGDESCFNILTCSTDEGEAFLPWRMLAHVGGIQGDVQSKLAQSSSVLTANRRAIQSTFRLAFYNKIIELQAVRAKNGHLHSLDLFYASCKVDLAMAFSKRHNGIVFVEEKLLPYLEKRNPACKGLIRKVANDLNASDSVQHCCPPDFKFTPDLLRTCKYIDNVLTTKTKVSCLGLRLKQDQLDWYVTEYSWR